MNNGFVVTPDVYRRGNGRWAKVSRLHDKVGEPVNGIQQWRAKYSVAAGYDGQVWATRSMTYPTKSMALNVAQDWIDYEG